MRDDDRFETNKVEIVAMARRLARHMSRRTGVNKDDLNQEALIAIWNATGDWPADTPAVWFAKVANWRMIDYVRRVTRSRTTTGAFQHELEFLDERYDFPIDYDSSGGVDTHLLLQEIAVDDPEDMAMVLRLEQGWKLREIAAERGITFSAVSQRRKRYFAHLAEVREARRQLRSAS